MKRDRTDPMFEDFLVANYYAGSESKAGGRVWVEVLENKQTGACKVTVMDLDSMSRTDFTDALEEQLRGSLVKEFPSREIRVEDATYWQVFGP